MYFSNALEKGSVISTSFTGTDGYIYCLVDDSNGNVAAARLDDDGVMILPHLYLIQPDGGTYQGTIDYTTGTIVLNSFRPLAISDSTSSIKLNVVPSINNSDIVPLREQILTYDVTDIKAITINMVAETII